MISDTNPPSQHLCGAQLSKREMEEELKACRRLDEIDPNMELNPGLVTKYHKVIIKMKRIQESMLSLRPCWEEVPG